MSAGVRTKNATDTGRHRRTVAQIKIMKKRSATQAIKPPALHRKGRTDEAHDIQAIWLGQAAPPARQIAIWMSIDNSSGHGLQW